MMEKRLFNIKDAANYLSITTGTLYQWVHKRKIQVIKFGETKGSGIRFDIKDLDSFIDEHKKIN